MGPIKKGAGKGRVTEQEQERVGEWSSTVALTLAVLDGISVRKSGWVSSYLLHAALGWQRRTTCFLVSTHSTRTHTPHCGPCWERTQGPFVCYCTLDDGCEMGKASPGADSHSCSYSVFLHVCVPSVIFHDHWKSLLYFASSRVSWRASYESRASSLTRKRRWEWKDWHDEKSDYYDGQWRPLSWFAHVCDTLCHARAQKQDDQKTVAHLFRTVS